MLLIDIFFELFIQIDFIINFIVFEGLFVRIRKCLLVSGKYKYNIFKNPMRLIK